MPGPGMIEIEWMFAVKVGPGVPITETSGRHHITVTDIPPDGTNATVAMAAAKLLGVDFIERFLVAMGAAKLDASGFCARGVKVTVSVEKVPPDAA